MDDDFGGGEGRSLLMLRMLGTVGTFMIPMLVIGLMAPLFIYVIARWRDNREPIPDPQLGVKFALGFFKWQGLQISIAGCAVLLYSITTSMPGEMREMIYRPAFGVLLPGLLVFGVAAWALTRTNNMDRPIVGRLLAGYNLVLTGMVAFVLLVIAFVMLFQKGSSGDGGRMIWSFTFVYVSAWIGQTAFFMTAVGVGPSTGNLPPA